MKSDQNSKKTLDYSIGISRNKTGMFNEYKQIAKDRKAGKFSKR